MKNLRLICLLLCSVLISTFSDAWAEKLPQYQLEGAGSATQGNYLVRVTVASKKNDLSDRDICIAAVHGVLFRGFSDPSNRLSQKPLAGSAAAEVKHSEFFDEFFGKDGSAASYASVLTGSRSTIKSGKEYKTSATVTVQKEALHKYLEDAGVLTGLNSIF